MSAVSPPIAITDGVVTLRCGTLLISDSASVDFTLTLTATGATLTATATGSGGAPADAEYLVAALHAGLSAERLATDTTNITWDFSVPGVAKANVGAITEAQVTGLIADLAAIATALAARQLDIQIQDEAVNQGAPGDATTYNFTGAGVTASVAGALATINIPGGGAGTVDIKPATITAPYNSYDYTEIIVDASVVAASQILLGWGATTSDDENTPDMEDMNFAAVADPAGGQFSATISASSNNAFGGAFKLNYLVG